MECGYESEDRDPCKFFESEILGGSCQEPKPCEKWIRNKIVSYLLLLAWSQILAAPRKNRVFYSRYNLHSAITYTVGNLHHNPCIFVDKV